MLAFTCSPRCLGLVPERVWPKWELFFSKNSTIHFCVDLLIWGQTPPLWMCPVEAVSWQSNGAFPLNRACHFPWGGLGKNGLIRDQACTHTWALSLCDFVQMAYPSESQILCIIDIMLVLSFYFRQDDTCKMSGLLKKNSKMGLVLFSNSK